MRRSQGKNEPSTSIGNKPWQTFDPKGGTKPTPDYLRPRGPQAPSTNPYRPDAATPPRVTTPTKPDAPTTPKWDPFGPNTKPFDPYAPKTTPWPIKPTTPTPPKPAPAPAPRPAPRKPPTKAPTKAPTQTNPWSPKSTTVPYTPTLKPTRVTSPSLQTQPKLQPITKVPGNLRTVAFRTSLGLAGASVFMPKAAPGGDDKAWYPSSIV